MITFGYLAGWRNSIRDHNIIGFIDGISNVLSFGAGACRDESTVLADFDGIIYVMGYPLDTLPTLIKEFESKQATLPPKQTLQAWNELIFNLYPDNSAIGRFLLSGHVRGVGLYRPEQRLYGGHLLIAESHQIELSASLTSIDILFELSGDIFLGLQSLMAIISNLESADLLEGITEWRLTLRPGMLYEEIFNGRNS